MCGIFGLIRSTENGYSSKELKLDVENLFELTESRGREASGLAVRSNGKISVFRRPVAGSELIRLPRYEDLFEFEKLGPSVSVVGHSRLVTNGSYADNLNNQPVVSHSSVGVHNGIVTNVDQLWERIGPESRESEVDSEVIFCSIARRVEGGESLVQSVQSAFGEMEGSASIAGYISGRPYLCLATNTGSLYFVRIGGKNDFVFCSERYMLKKFLDRKGMVDEGGEILQLEPGTACLIHLQTLEQTIFSLSEGSSNGPEDFTEVPALVDLVEEQGSQDGPAEQSLVGFISIGKIEEYETSYPDLYEGDRIRRCTRCILPETFPFISFDMEGVCSVCRDHVPHEILGVSKLKEAMRPFTGKSPDGDCVVPFSGGRDSCYGLHFIREELGLKPVAYTYDWGMVTDLARRNQARFVGKLGVEHVIVSADIRKKRRNIQLNLSAWLKNPSLGMIPILMAGDKQFYYYASRLMRQTGIEYILYSAGNAMEKTRFKTGFCGVDEGVTQGTLSLSGFNTLKLLAYYGRQGILNPSYINRSMSDTISAFYSSYLAPKNAAYLFHFIPWEERAIESILQTYGWESAPDTKATWRIGDGTASFYNFVYYKVAGFSENDTFRSNQVREGQLERTEALRLVREENRPRWDSIKIYCELVGVDYEEMLKVVRRIPVLYGN